METITDKNDNLVLLEKARLGDKEAFDTLILANLGLVKNIVRRFLGRGAEYDDLVQIGTIGIIKAAKSFDPSFNCAFSTYAVPLIIGEIRRFLRDDGIIKISRNVKKQGAIIMKCREEFMNLHSREPKISELSEMSGISPEEILYASEAACPVQSLQDKIGNDENSATLEDVTANYEDEIESICTSIALKQAIKTLSDFRQQIIELRFFKNLSQMQCAKILGVTQVKISREEKKILALLKEQL